MNNIPDPNLAGRPASITPSDIYYTLFRHKWKIILCSILGFVAAAAVYLLFPKSFSSEARLFIRYVEQGKERTSFEPNSQQIATLEGRGEAINSELQIITSMDLALKIAEKVGSEKILDDHTKKYENIEAAQSILNSLKVSVPSRSSVISIRYENSNDEVVQAVLSELIDAYLAKHLETRSGGSFDSFVNIQAEQYRTRLNKTEEELQNALERAGVISLEEAKADQNTKISSIKGALLDSSAELAARKAALEQLKGFSNKAANSSIENASIPEPAVDESTIHSYASILARLDFLRRNLDSLRLKYTSENALVKGAIVQIEDAENQKTALEKQHPLLIAAAPQITQSANSTSSRSFDYRAEAIHVAALESKIQVLQSQFNQINQEAERLRRAEIEIQELRRRKAIEEQNYTYFSQSREQAKIDQAFGAGRVNNIGIVQKPTPPKENTDSSLKMAAMSGIALIGFGVAWAFLIEFYLDRTVKRPIDVKRVLNIPLFLSIPDTSSKKYKKLLRKTGNTAALLRSDRAKKKKSDETYEPESPALRAAALTEPEKYASKSESALPNSEASPMDDDHMLHPYYEALRDRMIGFFEGRGLTHKPKLIGLTGLGENPGTTTIASGLASTLSKTGEGNVLLVDMNLGQESAQQFYRGEAVSNLDQVLENTPSEKRNTGKLVVAAEGSNGYNLPKILPNRFNDIVPKLKSSDFDYIIFDMPAVSPISVTPRLASFMDSVLLVIESEKATKDVVERATELLQKTNQHVGAILNRTKSYVPSKFQEEFLGDL